ncbi:5-formyltetrahydrofolate cyclo-ligase [Planktothrix pseudagardhii]|uniref:5-formyltetrahydrofolate cyclo-ligase n=1 Tax=Planktothrix pseudagardhii TaxID=132604 RepID=A0A9W4CP35_9CYAN|nr:5-formyltetrahydrofolate cyclo-ligase [Planktothrix pseudagardhii]CAD5942492.1 5-formyltetrahydrofolate cyclo-ligase [Planktothrix pseudagardhii]
MLNQTKPELRRLLIKQRRSLLKEDWKEKSENLCQNLKQHSLFQQSKTILSYFSFRQEPDLSLLWSNTPKTWGFPRCFEQSLTWHCWQPGDTYEMNRYGILEPHINLPKLKPGEVDLILVPSVACDAQGYRLGYGGGFYDRMLSLPEWNSIPTVGIIFDSAYLPQLPIDSWDQPLNAVCTESNFFDLRV